MSQIDVINIKNFDIKNLIVEKNHSKERGIINVYYNTFQKVILKTPKTKIIYMPNLNDITQHKSITVSLFPTTNEISKFVNTLRKIDAAIRDKIDLKMKNSVRKSNGTKIMYLSMPFDKKNNNIAFEIFNDRNKISDISLLKKLSDVSSFIELNGIWYKNDICGVQWNIIKIKVYNNIDFLKCVFSDCEEDDDNIPVKNNIPPPPKNISDYNGPIMLHLPPPPPPQIIKLVNKFAPTNEELLQMKNKLKHHKQHLS